MFYWMVHETSHRREGPQPATPREADEEVGGRLQALGCLDG
jgi:hypothetical protein